MNHSADSLGDGSLAPSDREARCERNNAGPQCQTLPHALDIGPRPREGVTPTRDRSYL
jgi:hypothetical protein